MAFTFVQLYLSRNSKLIQFKNYQIFTLNSGLINSMKTFQMPEEESDPIQNKSLCTSDLNYSESNQPNNTAFRGPSMQNQTFKNQFFVMFKNYQTNYESFLFIPSAQFCYHRQAIQELVWSEITTGPHRIPPDHSFLVRLLKSSSN